jgi:hypothetical protein
MDLAVAFVGRDWSDALANFDGNLRVICWLSSTNTNPLAVRQLIKRRSTKVRQRDGMHAKVYLTNMGAVVGSANLSAKALSEIEQNGQDEAAVLLKDKISRNTIDKWFRKLWDEPETRKITEEDLNQAEIAYRKAHKSGGRKSKSKNHPRILQSVSPARRQELLNLARTVRDQDIATQIGFSLEDVVPQRIPRSTLVRIVDHFAAWMGRRFLFERAFIENDIVRVRSAMTTLFDESLDVVERLESVIESHKLSPLGIPSLSLLLYCRAPEKYPPFNRRTKRFLEDFRLKKWGISNASAEAYQRWLDQAEELSQELDLPSPGHLDRVVWQYTKDLQL